MPLQNDVSGVFVDSQGRLDLSRAALTDSGIYRCTGVDVAGASAFRLYNVDIVDITSISCLPYSSIIDMMYPLFSWCTRW